jgi:hypothetical protein
MYPGFYTLCTSITHHNTQALNLFRRKTGVNRFFSVRLDKKVPHGAFVD